MTTVKTKAKRKISKFNFEAEGSAVALVSASQGGAANSFKTLVIKSADKYSKEFIQKAQKVQVVMEFDDFLQKFFDMWKEDAKILTSILGFGDEGMDSESELDDLGVYNDDYFYEWFDEKLAEEGATYRSPTEEDKLAWLEYRKQGITLVKSLAETNNKLEMLAALSEKDYWSVINEQKLFEKALKQKDLSGGEPTTPVVEAGKISKKAKPAVHNQEENQMSGNQPEISVEDAVALKKALEDQKVELQKALEAVELFKAKEKEVVEKAREAEVIAAVVDVDASAKLFKAVKDLEDEAFKDVVDVVKALTAKVDESEMFKEKGSKESGEKVSKAAAQANPVAAALQARLAAAQQ
jgi:hypothetical protein